MKNLDYREYYRRNLPHIQPRGATFLVNFRLTGSLPAEIVERFRAETERPEKKRPGIKDREEILLWRDKEQRQLFAKFDSL